MNMVAAGLVVLALDGCSAGDASKSEGSAAFLPVGQAPGNSSVAKINPCSMLTDGEIAAQVDLTLEPDQRKASHELGVTHRISRQEDRQGAFPSCHFSWRSTDSSGQETYRGTFDVHVMTATQLKALEGLGRPKSGKRSQPIPGVGDEAFFEEYAPAARVGDLGMMIAEFPSTYEGGEEKGAVELLRAAARRLLVMH
jgi:hypothetical protein